MKPAEKPQVQAQSTKLQNARPTISLERVLVTGTQSFSGWGPKVACGGSIAKNWN